MNGTLITHPARDYRNAGWVLLAALVATSLGCRTGLTLGPSYPANRADQLRKVQQRLARSASRVSQPPVAYLVTDQPAGLAAFDLQAGKLLWRTEAQVQSRVIASTPTLVHLGAGTELVVRKTSDGTVRWTEALSDSEEVVGLATDGARVYVASKPSVAAKGRSPAAPAGRLTAFDARSGSHLWARDSVGALGAPDARSGLVLLPLRSQSIAVLDGKTGQEIARVRSRDEALLWVRADSGAPASFGGQGGVYLLDERAGLGRDGGAGFLRGDLPRISNLTPAYWRNGYYEAARYTAYDRARVLWRLQAGDQPTFRHGLVFLQHYHFLFAFEKSRRREAPSADPVGDDEAASRPVDETQEPRRLRWAVHLGRKDIVASSHTGRALLFVDRSGDILAIDPTSGAQFARQSTGLIVRGAHLAAESFVPPSSAQAGVESLLTALLRIVKDPDRRFDPVKLFCVEQIARIEGADASAALLQLVQQGVGPARIQERAGELLIARQDDHAIPLYVEALRARYAYAEPSRPQGTAVLARAVGALKAGEAVPPLVLHLADHETPISTVEDVLGALHAIGDAEVLSPVRDFLLTYRCDPAFASNPRALRLAAQVLLDIGTAAERELLQYVAADPRTLEVVRIYITNRLAEPAPAAGSPDSADSPASAPAAAQSPAANKASEQGASPTQADAGGSVAR